MNGSAGAVIAHPIVLPVLLPLAAAAVILLLGERRRQLQAAVNLAACVGGLLLALNLLRMVSGGADSAAIGVYLPGNWDVPFGIVLVVDRLSALLLLLASSVALAGLLFSLAGWHRAGIHFHVLWQLQLLGLNGAFLTADVFNLFVFFEILLAASYGLLLHGSGRERVASGMHYIAINLAASSLLLIGIAILYGVTGTLNMADMADKMPRVPAGDQGLLRVGAAVLAVAFLIKAALWPLNFWLVPAYGAASPPVAGLFAIMTKVGVYALLRMWTLLFGGTAEVPAHGVDGAALGATGAAAIDAAVQALPGALAASSRFGAQALVWGGLATIGFGAIGMLASQRLSRLAGYSVIASAGTLLAAFGFAQPALTAGALYYLAVSSLSAAALFLLVDLGERSRQTDEIAVRDEQVDDYGFLAHMLPQADANLDDDELPLVGKSVPASKALLGLGFIVSTLLVAGLPPLSGFVAKFAMLDALFGRGSGVDDGSSGVPAAAWLLGGLLIGSGLFALVALTRAGIRLFWASHERAAPRLRVVEALPIFGLLVACTALTVQAESALAFTRGAAAMLNEPRAYVQAVLSAQARPGVVRMHATPQASPDMTTPPQTTAPRASPR